MQNSRHTQEAAIWINQAATAKQVSVSSRLEKKTIKNRFTAGPAVEQNLSNGRSSRTFIMMSLHHTAMQTQSVHLSTACCVKLQNRSCKSAPPPHNNKDASGLKWACGAPVCVAEGGSPREVHVWQIRPGIVKNVCDTPDRFHMTSLKPLHMSQSPRRCPQAERLLHMWLPTPNIPGLCLDVFLHIKTSPPVVKMLIQHSHRCFPVSVFSCMFFDTRLFYTLCAAFSIYVQNIHSLQCFS